jgi:F-type H+-transporting ATPase subunit gamma
VELGLGVCFRQSTGTPRKPGAAPFDGPRRISAVVFGSDQGLVGRFNEIVADYAISELGKRPEPTRVWAVGERVVGRLADAGRTPEALLPVPSSVQGITSLVGELLMATGTLSEAGEEPRLCLFYNRPTLGTICTPVCQQLLPLDDDWQRGLVEQPWPTPMLPETIANRTDTLRGLLHEYLFVLMYRAAAESLASEHASRLSAMQRAEKNIEELLEVLTLTFHRLRQSAIDEELFDVVSGFTALVGAK